jgi:hypothetical protein
MTNNKQQTAVEWFANESWQLKVQLDNQEISVDEYAVAYVRLLYKAKEMEKEQRSIELPTDEEIKKIMELDGMEFDEFDPYDVSYLGGACWMRDKIQGGNK